MTEEEREDQKTQDTDEGEAPAGSAPLAVADGSEAPLDVPTDAEAAAGQLGARRFVYAAYFGGAIAVAFLGSKAGNLIWYRLSQWKPAWGLGEPHDEYIMAISAVVGALLALRYWRKPEARTYVEEVAHELGAVTWPSRKEVTNSTMVVVFTTLLATAFFALMDQFWRAVTDQIYKF